MRRGASQSTQQGDCHGPTRESLPQVDGMNGRAFTWLVSPGASSDALNELVLEAGPLPRSYLECLRLGNGGEVGLRVSPWNMCLYSAESALDYWRSGTYTTQQVFVFGSSGGGDLLAFD